MFTVDSALCSAEGKSNLQQLKQRVFACLREKFEGSNIQRVYRLLEITREFRDVTEYQISVY